MLYITKEMDYLCIVPFSVAIDELQFFEHVCSKLLPHVIQIAIVIIIIKKHVYNGNGSGPEAAMPLAQPLRYLTDYGKRISHKVNNMDLQFGRVHCWT
jgi:hypothetical protein